MKIPEFSRIQISFSIIRCSKLVEKKTILLISSLFEEKEKDERWTLPFHYILMKRLIWKRNDRFPFAFFRVHSSAHSVLIRYYLMNTTKVQSNCRPSVYLDSIINSDPTSPKIYILLFCSRIHLMFSHFGILLHLTATHTQCPVMGQHAVCVNSTT